MDSVTKETNDRIAKNKKLTKYKYLIMAKRANDRGWSQWTVAETYEQAKKHYDYIFSIGYIAKIHEINGDEVENEN